MIIDDKIFQTFVDHYLVALLWSSHVVDESNKNQQADEYDTSPELVQKAEQDCHQFIDAARGCLLLLPDDYTIEQAGHDFALTRNGHGAGFFDRDLGDLGDRLTEYADRAGQADLYIGDDGLLYQE